MQGKDYLLTHHVVFEKKFPKIAAGVVSAMGRRLKIAPPWLFMTKTVTGGRSLSTKH